VLITINEHSYQLLAKCIILSSPLMCSRALRSSNTHQHMRLCHDYGCTGMPVRNRLHTRMHTLVRCRQSFLQACAMHAREHLHCMRVTTCSSPSVLPRQLLHCLCKLYRHVVVSRLHFELCACCVMLHCLAQGLCSSLSHSIALQPQSLQPTAARQRLSQGCSTIITCTVPSTTSNGPFQSPSQPQG
jgi:hypothetical protein